MKNVYCRLLSEPKGHRKTNNLVFRRFGGQYCARALYYIVIVISVIIVFILFIITIIIIYYKVIIIILLSVINFVNVIIIDIIIN